jgi:iron complex outermembrane recepter protein
MRRIPVLVSICCVSLCLLLCVNLRAQSATGVKGQVMDTTGSPVPNAAVTLTDLTTNTAQSTTTGGDGKFQFDHVLPDPQLVAIEKSGFESFSQHITPAKQNASTTIHATLQVATLAESVVVRGTVDPEAKPVPSRDDVMLTPDTIRVLDRKQLDAAGPVAGGAQMIESTPGANVIGYGETGATKYSILLNGIPQGWAGEATSFTEPGSLGITFDGVPISDPATGLWQSATMPQNLVIQNLETTYGPGQPMSRWYNSAGGSVEFTPIQPTVDPHLSLAVTDGSYGQQNFAFVGNTGRYKGWSTVAGGGLGRGDDYLQGPDGFGNHSQDGSVFGKTIKNYSAGSIVLGVMYAKAGGYRPTVIPMTDVGLPEPNTNISFSQQTSGFYSVMPYADYNKYDTNEEFLTYGRENLFLSPSSTLQNLTWYNHIRRLHRRLQDAISLGDQVNEYNNPHSDIFGDQVGMSKVFPLNTINFGGFLLHEIYNAHNLFYSPADGGSGPEQIVGAGSKFRSGYFQQDNVAFYAQDDFHPIPRIHIIPGVRVDGFGTSYSDQAARDFTFAPSTYFAVNSAGETVATAGPVYQTHCALNPVGSDPYNNIFGTPAPGLYGTSAKDQGSLCGAHESRSAVEPSIDGSYTPKDWITIYGGYDTLYRSPALGGGGGMFQAVNPNYYILAKAAYSQGGVKVHFMNAPGLRNFIAGVNYFHNDYTNQEIDVETALGVEETSGGNSTYHGVDAFFDDDPASNIHFFFNFAGEASNYTTYVTGGPLAECGSSSNAAGLADGCAYYNGLPVAYVPNVTLNTGIYYGIKHNSHELIEPRFVLDYIGSQHLWSNASGAPTNQTMPSYLTTDLSFRAPITFFEKQSFTLEADILNLANSRYNEFEYISSGGYFSQLCMASSTCSARYANNGFGYPVGYINAYPGAPRSIYGTISYQF